MKKETKLEKLEKEARRNTLEKESESVIIYSKQNINVKGLYLPAGIRKTMSFKEWRDISNREFSIRTLIQLGIITIERIK